MKLKERIKRWLFAAEYQQLEQLQVQLGGVLTAAEGWISEPAKRGDFGWSLAYQRTLDLRIEANRLQDEIKRLQPKPPRFDRYRAMDEDQLAEVLAGAGELPAVKAVIQMIDEKFQQASDESRDPANSERVTAHTLGGAEWILKLKAELQAALEQERKPEARR